MEVHHHAHTARKKWSHYFWEFIMLFLAVFCGFLAEYKLEHVIEHQREKDFMKSMVEDLQDDHDKLAVYSADLKLGLARMDTLISLLGKGQLNTDEVSLVYYLARVAPRVGIFSNNSRTLEQLKNSGSFRLIRRATASSRIMDYYNNMEFIRKLEQLYLQEFEEYKRIASGILDPIVLRSMEMPDGNISRESIHASLRTNDPDRLKSLGFFAVQMNGSRRSIIPAVDALQINGDELSEYLKKEYRLK